MPPSKLTGQQKAAILLLAMGEDAAALVMKHLPPGDIRKIGSSMAEFSTIAREDEAAVIQDFKKSAANAGIGVEGLKYVASVLDKALGKSKANQVMASLVSESYPGIESLKWMDAKSVTQLLRIEHPQTIAVVLAHLDSEQASQVLVALPEALRGDVVLRLATMDEVEPDTLRALSEALEDAVHSRNRPSSMVLGGTKVTAEIITRMGKANESAILDRLAQKDAALAETIRSLMFVFDDIVKIDDRGIQEIMKEVNKEELTLAIRAANPTLKEKIFKNMSSRAAQSLKEDMESRGPAKLTDIERAQQNILKIVRRLEEEGKIIIGGAGSEAMV